MMKESWGVYCMEKEVEEIKDVISKKGLEIFEVRKLDFIEMLQLHIDPFIFANDPWIIMFKASKFQYYRLIRKLKMKPVF